MQIKSSFRDYYDSIQATGQDRTLVYIRNKVVIGCDPVRGTYPFLTFRPKYVYHRSMGIENYTVGFCGRVYPIIKVVKSEQGTSKFCFNIDDIDEFVTTNYKKPVVADYFSKVNKWNRMKWPWGHARLKFIEFYQRFSEAEPGYRTHFETHKCPVFIGYKTPSCCEVHYNGMLRDAEFFRVIDPYRAFQEIAMYLNNQAVPLKPIPEIDDETMAEIKGFDKFSFRKPSNKKTPKSSRPTK